MLVLPVVALLGLSVRSGDEPAAAETASASHPRTSAPVRTSAPSPSPRTPSRPPAAAPARTVAAASPAATASSTARSSALPASGTGKRVVVSKSRQRVWLVDADGSVRRSYLVSGMTSQPDPGSYRVFVRQAATSSAVDDSTMKWFVGFTVGKYQGATIGFHDIPRDPDGRLEQTRAQLGTPLSAGCFRQWEDDAKALWAFAPIGTRVVVVA